MLVGMKAPMEKEGDPALERKQGWLKRLEALRDVAGKGLTMEQVRTRLRDPQVWRTIRQTG